MNATVQLDAVGSARAVGITGPGGIDRLIVFTREVRQPAEGEVRISVRAAAVNPTDILLRNVGIGGISRADSNAAAPTRQSVKPGYDPDLPPPWIPGMEAAGIVDAVGPGVEHLRVGDKVMTVVSPRRAEGGAQASLLIAPAASTVRMPEGVGFLEAAAIPMNGLTAMLGLELLALKPGDRLAVTGGAGMLASYVIPMAKKRGLVVVADAGSDDEALVKGFGADFVVPRGDRFVAAVKEVFPKGVHGLYDTALRLDEVLGAIADEGAIVTVRSWNPEDLPRGIRAVPVWVVKALERTDWLEQLRKLAAAGVIKPRIAGEFPPEQAGEAHRKFSEGGVRGRLVIVF